MIGIVNYGLGNIGAIQNILKKLGYKSIILNNQDDFLNIETLILPGVGSFDYGMEKLNDLNLIEPMTNHAVIEKKLTIGICLGMQLMMNSSEEGGLAGLGWFKDKVIKFNFSDNSMKVPHMGWNYVKSSNKIFNNSFEEQRFYFVHSYFVPINKNYTIAQTNYGDQKFSSAICENNIYGFQFHPEKSHKYGMELLSNLFNKT
tara:strand:- start:14516 stop:15121 length:606 start_codon:yes stop_codon:yes gene_type:complete